MTDKTVIYIVKGFARSARTLETLSDSNELAIGTLFLAVARHHNKSDDDYPRWPSFEDNRSEFEIIKSHMESLESDLEKLQFVCEWLGEDPIT